MSDIDMDSSAYVEVQTLTSGHCDTVNALSFSPDGNYLASGGDDYSLLVWNVPREQLMYRLLCNGPVSCIIWHPTHADTLIVGCDDGSIVQMHDFTLVGMEQHDIRIGVRSEVHCLDYEARTRCLAIGIGNEVHITREQERNKYIGDVVLPAPPDCEGAKDPDSRLRAVSVHFSDGGQQVIVSYLVHGIVCYDVTKCEPVWTIATPSTGVKIGSSALSGDGKSLIAYNFDRGVSLFSLVSRKNKPIGTYELECAPRSKHRVQIAFVQKGGGIVCGTTTGSVCVWYKESREIFQKLHHDDAVIQALATVDRGPFSYIATGSVEQGQATKIKLWRAKMKESHKGSERRSLEDTVVDLVETITTKRVQRRIVHQALVIAYYGVIWFVLAVALALAYIQVPWPTVGNVFKDLLAFVLESLVVIKDLVQDATKKTYDGTAHLMHVSSEWLRMKAITWLQISTQDLADDASLAPPSTTAVATYTLTVTSGPTETSH